MTQPTHPRPLDPSELGFETIVYEKAPPRATIRLNRPDVLNAFDFQMLREIARACEDASWDDDIRAVVVTGTGRAFCVGADLRSWDEDLLGNSSEYWKWFGAFKDMHDERVLPGAEVGADAERTAVAGDDDDPDLVVPRGVLARARDLAQHPEVERVEHVRPVERDRGPWRRLLVDDRLEAERRGVDRARMARLRHQPISTKSTVNGMPIAMASFPEAANASELVAALNASMSSHSNSA